VRQARDSQRDGGVVTAAGIAVLVGSIAMLPSAMVIGTPSASGGGSYRSSGRSLR
jgi:hypothetical protein